MKICLFLVVGRDIFGLGIDFEWLEADWGFELQLGPVNLYAGHGWGMWVSFLGRRIYTRS